MTYLRWHEPEDNDKVERLAQAMRESGWQGAPLVCWGEQLYTGAHRSAAAEKAGIEFPVIDIEEIFEEAGIDLDEAHEWAGYPTADDTAMTMVFAELPQSIKDKYGIDIE